MNGVFAAGLRAGKFKSWVDTTGGDSTWLARHLGDFYPHETVIANVRRLLSTTFARKKLKETPGQFAARMKKVERHMNREMGNGQSLLSLGKSLIKRSPDLKQRKGERLPK